tara:strand:- start:32 stop:673 length:642 start_codon:yes stop_codon:yes gene_type:complete
MSRSTKAQLVWTLTVLRNGSQGPVEGLENAEFRFGRTGEEVVRSYSGLGLTEEEVERRRMRRLSTGVASLVKSFDIEEDALESGFMIEIRRTTGHASNWREYSMLAGNESWGPSMENPRSVYACHELEGSVEFADVGSPCSFYNQLPRRLWIRVSPLTMPIIAWAISNEIFSCPKGDQRSLHEWVDMGSLTVKNGAKELILPGPPYEEYYFLS